MLGEEERSSEIGSFSESSIPKRIAIVAARRNCKFNFWFTSIFYTCICIWKLYFNNNRFSSAKLCGKRIGDRSRR